jgi:hypothetical protein
LPTFIFCRTAIQNCWRGGSRCYACAVSPTSSTAQGPSGRRTTRPISPLKSRAKQVIIIFAIEPENKKFVIKNEDFSYYVKSYPFKEQQKNLFLSLFVVSDFLGCAQLMITRGARVNARDMAGHTPLHLSTGIYANRFLFRASGFFRIY